MTGLRASGAVMEEDTEAGRIFIRDLKILLLLCYDL